MKYLLVTITFLSLCVGCKDSKPENNPTEEVIANKSYENPAGTNENEVETPEETVQDSITVHTFKEGETLWDLGKQYYGNRHYSAILGIYNGIENVHTIEDGTLIKIPTMEVLIKDPALGMTPLMETELDDILEARRLFMQHETALGELREHVEGTNLLTLPKPIKKDLEKATQLVEDAITNLHTLKETEGSYPQKMVNQLNSLATLLSTLSMGKHDGVYRYDLDMVHQHLVRAFLAGRIWGIEQASTS